MSALAIASVGPAVVLAGSAVANSGTIVANGARVTATITAPGDSAQFSFTGSAGDVDNVTASAGTYPAGCDVSIAVVDSYRRTIAGPVCASGAAFLGSITLPGTGTYLLAVTPNNGKTGSVKVQIQNTPPT